MVTGARLFLRGTERFRGRRRGRRRGEGLKFTGVIRLAGVSLILGRPRNNLLIFGQRINFLPGLTPTGFGHYGSWIYFGRSRAFPPPPLRPRGHAVPSDHTDETKFDLYRPDNPVFYIKFLDSSNGILSLHDRIFA